MAKPYERYIKRVLDCTCATTLIIGTAPIHALCALAIKLDSEGPIYFHQERVGENARTFRIHKFRTMPYGNDKLPKASPQKDRPTRVGGFLRRYSLDELPQLFNILLGEMSFIGPRPALTAHAAQYTGQQSERLMVRPGLSGLAQVEHRKLAPWSVRIETDREYVRDISFLMDLKIALRTLPAILRDGGQVAGQVSASNVDFGIDSTQDHTIQT